MLKEWAACACLALIDFLVEDKCFSFETQCFVNGLAIAISNPNLLPSNWVHNQRNSHGYAKPYHAFSRGLIHEVLITKYISKLRAIQTHKWSLYNMQMAASSSYKITIVLMVLVCLSNQADFTCDHSWKSDGNYYYFDSCLD